MEKLYYVFFTITFLGFVYFLFFWSNQATRISNTTRKQIFSLLQVDLNSNPDSEEVLDRLIRNFKILFNNRKGICNEKKMISRLQKCLNYESAKGDPGNRQLVNLLTQVIEKMQNDNPYCMINKNTASIFFELESQVENFNEPVINKNLNKLYHIIAELETDKSELNIKSYFVGILGIILSVVFFLVPLIIK